MAEGPKHFLAGLFLGLLLGLVIAYAATADGKPIEGSYPRNMAAGEGRTPCDKQCRREKRMWKRVKPWNAKLERMAACESGRRWHIDGQFDGGLQFHPSTWWAAGGSGYAYQASKLEQKYRAVIWHDKIGTWVTTAGWPRCGYA